MLCGERARQRNATPASSPCASQVGIAEGIRCRTEAAPIPVMRAMEPTNSCRSLSLSLTGTCISSPYHTYMPHLRQRANVHVRLLFFAAFKQCSTRNSPADSRGAYRESLIRSRRKRERLKNEEE